MRNAARNEASTGIRVDPQHPNSAMSGQMPSDEHLMAMGKIIAAFAQLEAMILACFALVLGCEPELAGMLANRLQVRERCDTLFNIFAFKLGAAKMVRSGKDPNRDRRIRRLSKLFDKIGKAIQVRNTVVHSFWSSDTEDDKEAHRFRWVPRPKEVGSSAVDWSRLDVEELLGQVDFINEVRQELFAFLWEHFGASITKRAKSKKSGIRLTF